MKVSIANLSNFLPVLSTFGFPFVAATAAILGVASTQISISMRSLIVVLSVTILIRLKIKKRVALEEVIFWSTSIFWIFYLIRLSFFTLLQSDILRYDPIYYWIWAIGACFLPMMAVFYLQSITNFHFLFKVFFALSSCTLLLAAPNVATEFIIDGEVRGGGRLQLESLNPISLGRLAVCVVILAIWFLTLNRERVNLSFLWFFSVFIIPFGIIILIYSGSRGPLLSLMACIAMIVFASSTKKRIKILSVLFFGAGLIFVSTPFLDSSLINSAIFRYLAALSDGDMATMSRLTSFQGAIEVFIDNPFFGGAMEEPTTFFYPHNIFLESLMSTGLVGFVFLLFAMLSGVLASYNLIRKRSPLSWVGLLFIVFLVQAQFSGAIYNSPEIWSMLALTALSLRSLRNISSFR